MKRVITRVEYFPKETIELSVPIEIVLLEIEDEETGLFLSFTLDYVYTTTIPGTE